MARNPDRICPNCGGGKKEEYPLCFTCSMEEQGKELCPECSTNYYDPEKYEKCFDCSKTNPEPRVGDDYPFDLPRSR